MLENKQLTEYFLSLKNRKTKHATKYMIKRYVLWRDCPLEEIIENGIDEERFFEEFLVTKKLDMRPESRRPIISAVRKFLVSCGIPLKTYRRIKQPLKYKDDKFMQDFLTLSGEAERTKINNNRYLAYYCDFREKTPTELIKELQIIEKKDLRVILKKFYDSLELKDRRKVVATTVRFYRWLGDYYIDLPKSMKGRKKTLMMDELVVEKELVKTLLQASDLRDSMIIVCCFESGLNPVDLVEFTYRDFKLFLNLDDPNEIKDVIIIPRIRKKTGSEILTCFGLQSLQYISRWLKYVKTILDEMNKPLTDSFPIFTSKHYPFNKLKVDAISTRIRKICYDAGLDFEVSVADFRNSFNTRTKPHLKHYDKELMMGHSGGIERHYDISTLEYYIEQYRKIWRLLFDLRYDDMKMGTLEDKMTEQELLIQDLQTKLARQTEINKIFYRIIGREIEDKGLEEALDNFFPKEK